MKTYKYPILEDWIKISDRVKLNEEEGEVIVRDILLNVKNFKNNALTEFTESYDLIFLENFKVSNIEFEVAEKSVPKNLKSAINLAKKNIESFHRSQVDQPRIVETTMGVKCWRRSIGIEKVGLYIPGGSAPLFSTILMLGIPAKLANCDDIIICTPPNSDGSISPVILYTAALLGLKKIYKVGGAQAIGAMAYGTETVPKVHKIFGPGNQFVTLAKSMVQAEGIAIDMPAGPSELLVIADKTANASFVAADLLSQAEHGPDSQVLLLTDSESLLVEVSAQLSAQLAELPRRDIAFKSMLNSSLVLFSSIKECFDFSNEYGPEHLIIASEFADNYIEAVKTAGSVFLGNYSCESAGDYASGTNHTLPTNGYAKSYSGVSLDSFVKKITFQKLDKVGLQNIGPSIEVMAEAEGLIGHKNAVSIRLKTLRND